MEEGHLLADIGKSILGAAALGFPAYLFGIPLLLAYLAAGVILGPELGFGAVRSAESIATLSEIGLVLLMFILGLEIDVRKLMQAGKAVLINGATQFLGCAFLSAGFFYLIGVGSRYGDYSLIYLAVACSLSSTLVVVKILSDQRELDSLTSRLTLGILVLQDLWAIGFLAVQPDLANLSALAIVSSLGKASMVVVISLLSARFILPGIFARAGKQSELMLIIAMAWCFAICGLADFLKVSVEMGALVAGVSIASFPYRYDVAAKISSLRDFFITLFFVSLGLKIPAPTSDVMSLAGLIIGFVLISRLLTVFPVLHILRYGNRASLLPAVNLSQVSEFAMVLGALGVTYGHIHKDMLNAFILAMIVTSLLSSFIIPRGHQIYRTLNRSLEALGLRDHVGVATATGQNEETPQVVLLGFFREASSLLHEIQQRYSMNALKNLMIVDFNPEAHQKLTEMGVNAKYGDLSHTDTIAHLHLESANLLVCTIPDHLMKGTDNLKLLRTLNHYAPKARKIMTAETIESAIEMYREGADYVFLPRLINSKHVADIIERVQSGGAASIREKEILELENRSEVIA